MPPTAQLDICLALRRSTQPSDDVTPFVWGLPTPGVTLRIPRGGLVAVGLTAEVLADLLARTLRGDDLVVALLLGRGQSQLRLVADRALAHAARDPLGVHVDAPPHDARQRPLAAALRLIAATMRRRSPAMWEALDALSACGDNARLAATALGCSGQAIRERRTRARAHATADLAPLLAALLASPASASAPIPTPTTTTPDSQGIPLANSH